MTDDKNQKLKWYKLKSSKCPKCSAYLKPEAVNGKLLCSNPDCSFSISEEKAAAIITDLVSKYSASDRFGAFDRSGWNRFDT